MILLMLQRSLYNHLVMDGNKKNEKRNTFNNFVFYYIPKQSNQLMIHREYCIVRHDNKKEHTKLGSEEKEKKKKPIT